MNIIDCREYLKEIKEESKKEISKLKETLGRDIDVLIIQVGDRPDSNKYVSNKVRHLEECGINAAVWKHEESITTELLCNYIDESCRLFDGVIIQEPLPKHIDNLECQKALWPEKDLDCLTPMNMGLLLKGEPFVQPCTPRGIIEILDRQHIDLTGKTVLIIGRSEIVGKPLQIMLTQRNATVTLAHTKTKEIRDGRIMNNYDIIISAAGVPEHFYPHCQKFGSVFIDVGINFNEQGKMVGDFNISKFEPSPFCSITPVPFGVGTMTCGMVIKNVIDIVKKNEGIE